MIFYAYFNQFAMKELLYDQTLERTFGDGYRAVFNETLNDDFTAYAFSNDFDAISPQQIPSLPLVNGDLIYYFELPNTRLTGVVLDQMISDVKFKLTRTKIHIWLEDKEGMRREFAVKEIPNVLLIKECLRKFVDRQGVIVWCIE